MKIEIFQSDKGDCLLITGADGRRLLADGGMFDSYTEHVAPALGALRQQNKPLDLVYVSHIDEDHIAGILQLMDDEVAWRVHDFQVQNGNPQHPQPTTPRPPQVKAIWHNAFHEALGKNAGPIENMLAATAKVLSGSTSAALKAVATRHQELATSERQAIRLSRRVGAKQLNIALNKEFGGKLILARAGQGTVPLGGMTISVFGPSPKDLERLRRKWNAWLKTNKKALREIARSAAIDEMRLATNEVDAVLGPLLAQAEELGQRSQVTAPNLASLMLLVEEGATSVLLTGDGHADDILTGLRQLGKLDAQGRIHVTVLKAQHHGSEHNFTPAFFTAVSADQYVFCGNGEHENPDLRVLDGLVRARLQDGSNRPFTLWFNSHASATKLAEAKQHMRRAEELVLALSAGSAGRVTHHFLEQGSKLELTV